MKIDAVVLAGGDAGKVVASLTGPKSLISIGGRPMISYVMDALRQCSRLDKIVVALPAGTDAGAFAGLGAELVLDTRGVIDAIDRVISATGPDGFILVVSSDTPMISAGAIDDFLTVCEREPADIYYMIVSEESIESRFPGTKRTYARLRDGVFTGGNVHLTRKETFIRNKEMGGRLFAERKSPLGLLRLLGIGFLVKYVFGRLTIPSLEKKAGRLLAAKVKAVVTDHPELGVDVDKPEDLEIAQDYLSGAESD